MVSAISSDADSGQQEFRSSQVVSINNQIKKLTNKNTCRARHAARRVARTPSRAAREVRACPAAATAAAAEDEQL